MRANCLARLLPVTKWRAAGSQDHTHRSDGRATGGLESRVAVTGALSPPVGTSSPTKPSSSAFFLCKIRMFQARHQNILLGILSGLGENAKLRPHAVEQTSNNMRL
jgi:hypothetical protein